MCFWWKHGYPHKNLRLLNDRVIHIFIVRDLTEWLVSMFFNSYHLYVNPKNTFKEFLKAEQTSASHIGTPLCLLSIKGEPINISDNHKTIFEIRYDKIKSYLQYYDRDPKNIVFVNLKYIQNADNCKFFLEKLNEYYNLNMASFVSEIPYHIKTNEPNIKNRNYGISLDESTLSMISRFKNDDLEVWVDNLTYEMY